jgi:hypothetical protein
MILIEGKRTLFFWWVTVLFMGMPHLQINGGLSWRIYWDIVF